MSEFTPMYPRENDTGEEVMVGFTQSEFYEVVYAAREAQIRYKRLRSKYREDDTLDDDTKKYRTEDCTIMIGHYKSMEMWLCDKYLQAYGENW